MSRVNCYQCDWVVDEEGARQMMGELQLDERAVPLPTARDKNGKAAFSIEIAR